MRPFNTYGPRQSTRAVIPTIITQIASGARRIKLGVIHPTRDFNYVQDTVRGFAAIAESENAVDEVINIGSNFEISVGDTARLIAELMGVRIEIETEEVRLRPQLSEVERLWAANAKAKRLAGWDPAYGGLEGFKRGMKETIDWFSSSDNLKLYKTGSYAI